MLLAGIALGLVAGLVAGGRLEHLVGVRLRFLAVLFLAVILRLLTEAGLDERLALVETLRLPLFAVAYGLLLVALWHNRRHPGLAIAFVGVLLNGLAIVVNGGYMPIWEPALVAAGFVPAEIQSPIHHILPPVLDAGFLLHAGPLSDLIPIPLPFVRNVASLGDLFLAVGLAFFLFATVVRGPGELEAELEAGVAPLGGLTGSARLPRTVESVVAGRSVRAETGLLPGRSEAGVSWKHAPPSEPRDITPAPAFGAAELSLAEALALPAVPAPAAPSILVRPSAPAVERARRHPYVRLALNGSFSTLWIGQLISLFGDRVHQVALAFLVLATTNHSPVAVSFVFVAATVPNLLIGPIAGTFVDRWDQKQVMIVSDLLRASIVLLIPIAAITNVVLVYPLVFLVTTISIFFRPARTAVLPRIVHEDELITANSATWLADSLADVVGYPLAGIFVAFLGSALPLAFWLDGASYLASAFLIATMAIPPLIHRETEQHRSVVGETLEGWRFLRSERVLLANTIQGVIGQFSTGALTALSAVYAATLVLSGTISASAAYSFLETAIGGGVLIGGVLVGLLGAGLPKGRTVIAGYVVAGLCMATLSRTDSLALAMALMFGVGIANMVYVIPSQTLFQQRTPAELMGRVVGTRFSLVFGSMTLAMAMGGFLTQAFGVEAVFGGMGLLMAAAGLSGLLLPAVRDA